MIENADYGDPNEILTIDELSLYLKIPKSTLYKIVREGKIPSQKVGRHWRFRKVAINAWLQKTSLSNNTEDIAKKSQIESDGN